MDPWIEQAAAEIARRAARELEALVGVSSPSRRRARRRGVRRGLRGAAARRGDGGARPVLLARPRAGPARAPDGHGRAARRCWSATSTPSSRTRSTSRSQRDGEQLRRLRRGRHEGRRRARARRAARARRRAREHYAEAALLLVCDEEWRTGAVRPRRALRRLGRVPVLRGRASAPDGDEGVVVRRKAAGTIHVDRARALARTPARRPTAAATRCSRSPPPPRRSPPATSRTARRA